MLLTLKDMISFDKFKELLGKEAKELTDEQIEEIRQAQYAFAELAFEIIWTKEKICQKK